MNAKTIFHQETTIFDGILWATEYLGVQGITANHKGQKVITTLVNKIGDKIYGSYPDHIFPHDLTFEEIAQVCGN